MVYFTSDLSQFSLFLFYLSLINGSHVNHLLREYNTVTGFICRSCIFLPKISILESTAYRIGLEAEFIPSGISLIVLLIVWYFKFLFSIFQIRFKQKNSCVTDTTVC